MTDAASLVERLRARGKEPVWTGSLLNTWDAIRASVEQNPGSSEPRDMFESLITNFADDYAEAADHIEEVERERDEAVNWSDLVKRHNTDRFDELADAWLALEAIKRVVNAATSSFSKWANDDLMERFRTHQHSMFHLAFVEGCIVGVAAERPRSEAAESEITRLRALLEKARDGLVFYATRATAMPADYRDVPEAYDHREYVDGSYWSAPIPHGSRARARALHTEINEALK